MFQAVYLSTGDLAFKLSNADTSILEYVRQTLTSSTNSFHVIFHSCSYAEVEQFLWQTPAQRCEKVRWEDQKRLQPGAMLLLLPVSQVIISCVCVCMFRKNHVFCIVGFSVKRLCHVSNLAYVTTLTDFTFHWKKVLETTGLQNLTGVGLILFVSKLYKRNIA